jgi:hypothetical protein
VGLARGPRVWLVGISAGGLGSGRFDRVEAMEGAGDVWAQTSFITVSSSITWPVRLCVAEFPAVEGDCAR